MFNFQPIDYNRYFWEAFNAPNEAEQNQQKLLADQYANAIAKVQAQYAPESVPTNIELNKSKIPLNYANAAWDAARTQYLPLNEQFKSLALQLQQYRQNQLATQRSKDYATYKAIMAMDKGPRDLWMQQHTQAYTDLIARLQNPELAGAQSNIPIPTVPGFGQQGLQTSSNDNAVTAQTASTYTEPGGQTLPIDIAKIQQAYAGTNQNPQQTVNASQLAKSGIGTVPTQPSQQAPNQVPSYLPGTPQQQQVEQQLAQQSKNKVPSTKPSQVTASAYQNLPTNQSGQKVLPIDLNSSSKQTQRLAYAFGLSANKGLNTNQVNNRASGARILVDFLNNENTKTNDAINVIAKYSGLEGKVKLHLDQLFNPEKYNEYVLATQQLSAFIQGSLKNMEGLPTTDQSLELGMNFFRQPIGTIANNPKAIIKYYNHLADIIDGEGEAINDVQDVSGVVKIPKVKRFYLKDENERASYRWNGKEGTIPRSQVDAFKKKYPDVEILS